MTAITTAARRAATTATARGTEQPLLPAPVARLIAFAVLAAYCAVQWGRMVDPRATGDLLQMLLVAICAAIVLIACGRRSPRERAAVTALTGLGLLVVALLLAGVADEFLRPRHWDELVSGIAQGLGSVSTVRVPYRGLDEWTRIVIVVGGTALIAVAALLAFAPSRGRLGHPIAAAVALSTLYAVPVMQRNPDAPFVSGMAFVILLALFLWLERVERRSVALAAAVVVAAALAGLALAPRLDAGRPLLDYEEIAQDIGAANVTQYRWNHGYGPLQWPRDGREVLRIKARDRAYWKTVNLTEFNGRGWEQAPREGGGIDTPILDPRWVQRLRVTVRALRSMLFVTAGSAIDIQNTPRTAISRAPGLYETAGLPLQRGNSYEAVVYVARPTIAQMQEAGTTYPQGFDQAYGTIGVPAPRGGTGIVYAPQWPQADAAALEGALEGSRYAAVLELAQRLRLGAETPYAYMRAIERHLANGFTYEEQPPQSAAPLADFLFRTRVGYCQHFSGAMALLLRMGGVPARVASGFSPGVLNALRDEYVVRDIDAHSWVEVYFPGIGWVTRDPTPAASPARAQQADLRREASSATLTNDPGEQNPAALNRDSAPAGAAAGTASDGGTSPLLIAALALTALLAVVAVVAVRRRRAKGGGPDPYAEEQLAELVRALRRSRRTPPPSTTLTGLAGRLDATPAEAYMRALAGARYGYASAGPTSAQRAALRRHLGDGLGPLGRLRAWWALPPRAPARRRSSD